MCTCKNLSQTFELEQSRLASLSTELRVRGGATDTEEWTEAICMTDEFVSPSDTFKTHKSSDELKVNRVKDSAAC